jgi:hypothetical protein
LEGVRAFGRFGLAIGLGMLAVGVALVLAAVVAGGGWLQAREPLIGWGLSITVGGLLITPPFAALRLGTEPIGWLRALAVLPAVIVAFGWVAVVVGGVGVFDGPPPEPGAFVSRPAYNIETVLYTRTGIFMLLVVATPALAAPLLIDRLRGGDQP